MKSLKLVTVVTVSDPFDLPFPTDANQNRSGKGFLAATPQVGSNEDQVNSLIQQRNNLSEEVRSIRAQSARTRESRTRAGLEDQMREMQLQVNALTSEIRMFATPPSYGDSKPFGLGAQHRPLVTIRSPKSCTKNSCLLQIK